MGQILHGSATTTHAIRAHIQRSQASNAATTGCRTRPSGSTRAWAGIIAPDSGWTAFDPINRAVGAANLFRFSVAWDISQVAPEIVSFHSSKFDWLAIDVTVSVEGT